MKTTNVRGCWRTRANNSASSPRLARVQSHRGCAIMIKVGPAGSRASALPAGQATGASAVIPGVLSYAINHASPAPTAPNQRTSRTNHTIACRRRLPMSPSRRLRPLARSNNVSLRCRRSHQPAAVFQNRPGSLARQRLVEVIALAELARELLQAVRLLQCLDAFGSHIHRKACRQRHDRANDLRVVAFPHAVHERPVNLDRLKWEVLEIAQCGVAHAKVVEAQLHAERTELAQNFRDRVRVLQNDAFGDFELET